MSDIKGLKYGGEATTYKGIDRTPKRAPIKRYYVELDFFDGMETIEHPEGDWVRYEDVKELLNE